MINYDAAYAKTRQALGETMWWYFINEYSPFFAPLLVNRAGIESRVPYWAAFTDRIRGFYIYDASGFIDTTTGTPSAPSPTIRFELMREGEEDFEYLLLAAGGTLPLTPDQPATCDETSRSVATSPMAFAHDAAALKHLRDALGFYLEGQRTVCPILTHSEPTAHPRGEYYVNFQDPNGEPAANPLVVSGHTWTKIGGDFYSPDAGAGWYSAMPLATFYIATDPADEVTRSGVFDNFEGRSTFQWDIENGSYTVTISIGIFNSSTYPDNFVLVEGQPLFDNVSTMPGTTHVVKSIDIDVIDGNVTLEIGVASQFTLLDWMSVVPR